MSRCAFREDYSVHRNVTLQDTCVGLFFKLTRSRKTHGSSHIRRPIIVLGSTVNQVEFISGNVCTSSSGGGVVNDGDVFTRRGDAVEAELHKVFILGS